MVRFIHTSDWQLGMRATGRGDAAEKVRNARFDTVCAIVEAAHEHAVDFILISGDLFEDNGVRGDTVRTTTKILEDSSPIPVYIIPGNHDPATADSVYNQKDWQTGVPGHVTVLDECSPCHLEDHGAVLFPCPIAQKQSREDPTKWIIDEDIDREDVVRIGMAHGSLDIHGHDPNFPISPDVTESAGLDYLALGDWHGAYEHDDRTAYSGTPEQTNFGESDTGGIFVVEIEEPGAVPDITAVGVAQCEWMSWEYEMSSRSVDEIREDIRNIEHPEQTLLRLTVRGMVDQEVLSEVSELKGTADERLFYAELHDDELRLMLERDEIEDLFPPGVLQRVGDALLQLRDGSPADDSDDEENMEDVMDELPDDLVTDEQTTDQALKILCDIIQTGE